MIVIIIDKPYKQNIMYFIKYIISDIPTIIIYYILDFSILTNIRYGKM